MKRRYFRIVIAGIIFILALLLTLYPIISNLYNQKHQSLIHTAYEEVIQQADTQELERIRELARAYNEAITPGTAADTYSKAALEKASVDYDSQLNPGGNGIMGYVEIPKISVNLPIYHGTEAVTLERGIGHLLGSSLPVGGKSTHSVVSAHRGLPTAVLFTHLDRMEVGDTFHFTILDRTITYEVDEIRIVEPNDVGLLRIEKGKEYCTLLTCTPYGINTQRLLVRGHQVDETQTRKLYIANEAYRIKPLIVMPIVALPIILVLLIYVMFAPVKKETLGEDIV